MAALNDTGRPVDDVIADLADKRIMVTSSARMSSELIAMLAQAGLNSSGVSNPINRVRLTPSPEQTRSTVSPSTKRATRQSFSPVDPPSPSGSGGGPMLAQLVTTARASTTEKKRTTLKTSPFQKYQRRLPAIDGRQHNAKQCVKGCRRPKIS